MNIFDQGGIAVVTTNTRGAMGAGIALQAAKRYPGVLNEYRDLLKAGHHSLGRPTHSRIAPIVYFATKGDYMKPSQYSYVESSLAYMRSRFEEQEPRYVYYFPPLGCGLGGLDSAKVRVLFDYYLGEWPEHCIPVGF